mmetsp:Transcript_69537/g.141362  ORF Transcript_69537/g.141362 Transcript_69537/m.141362 type:complete len:203 (-) Transcript_69537:136-744(-)
MEIHSWISSTFPASWSLVTAETTMGANKSRWDEMSLLLSAVPAHFSSISSWSPATASSPTLSTANFPVFWITWIMRVGEIPSSTSVLSLVRISAASRTTDVVPSPTAVSWLMEMSTRVFAAGWAISRSFMIVAPSLLIVVLPPVATSLSIPRGPSVVRTASATAWQALMLLTSWGVPCEVSVPSRRIIIPGRIPPMAGFMMK